MEGTPAEIDLGEVLPQELKNGSPVLPLGGWCSRPQHAPGHQNPMDHSNLAADIAAVPPVRPIISSQHSTKHLDAVSHLGRAIVQGVAHVLRKQAGAMSSICPCEVHTNTTKLEDDCPLHFERPIGNCSHRWPTRPVGTHNFCSFLVVCCFVFC